MIRVVFLVIALVSFFPLHVYADEYENVFPLSHNLDSVVLLGIQNIINLKLLTIHSAQYQENIKRNQFNFTIWNTKNPLQILQRDISLYTGFKPSIFNSKTQMSTNSCSDELCVPSSIQAEGNTIGLFANSIDAAHGNIVNASSEFFFPSHYRLFDGYELFQFSYDLQVPYAKGIAYTAVCLDLKDNKHQLPLWYCVNVFDSRPHEIQRQGDWIQARDIGTGTPIIHTPVGGEAKYATKTKTCSTPQNGPWKGYKHFGFTISQKQLAQAVRDTKIILKAYNPQSKFNNLSENPKDYFINSMNFQAETFGKSALGMSARNHEAKLYRKEDMVGP